MRIRTVIVSALLALGALSLSAQDIRDPVGDSRGFYAIQVGAYLDLPDAEARQDEFEALGYSPVWIQETDTWKRVFFGQFEFHVDAIVFKRDLRRGEIAPDAFERYFAEGSGLSLEEHTGPLTPVFATPVAPSPEAMAAAERADDLVLQGNEALRADDISGAQDLFSAVVSDTSLAGTQAQAEASLRLGYLALRTGDRETAHTHLWPVANGDLPADKAMRTETQLVVARLLHIRGDRVTAYQAFQEIGASTQSEDVQTECDVECVGLAMELAESRIGTHREVRRRARQAFAQTPESSTDLIHRRSTLELMFQETYSRQPEPDLETAVRLGEEFIARYSALGEDAPLREIAAAMHQTGTNYLRLGDEEQALRFYSRVADEIPQDVEHFAGIDPHAQAMIGIARVAEMQGANSVAHQMLEDAIELFPEDITVQALSEHQPVR
jgi:tetratricopeptide (TPR) repeat protein